MTTAPRPLGHGFGREPWASEAAARDPPKDAPADRLHNREDPSTREMAEMLREVQDALGVLDQRLEGLQGAQGTSSVVTRRLAENVAEMGEALARRVRLLEGREATSESAAPPERPVAGPIAPPPRRPENRLALSLCMAAILGLILAGVWMLGQARTHHALGAKPAPRAAAASAAIGPAPAITPHPAVPLAAAPHRTIAPRVVPATPADAGAPVAGYRPFGPGVTTVTPSKMLG